MRTIKIPKRVIDQLVHGPRAGRALVSCVHLNWPELRLTEDQILSNAVARAYGKEPPFPDNNLIKLELPYPNV